MTKEFKQEKRVVAPKDSPEESGVTIGGNIPDSFKQIAARQAQAAGMQPVEEPEDLPKITKTKGFQLTGNEKLDELLAGLKKSKHHYEPVTLPSLGKFYDGKDGPVDGILHIRPMSGEEEEILATPRNQKTGLSMIFSRCILEKLDSDNFLVEDRGFLLIYLRGISFTPDYEVSIKCPECGEKFAHVIDLDNDLSLDYCPEDFGPTLTDILPTSGYKVTYRLPTIKDENQITNHRTTQVKEWGSGSVDDSLTYRLSYLTEEIEGLTGQRALQQLIKNMPVNDLNHLRDLINNPPFGTNTTISDVSCLYCDHRFDLDMPLDSGFFFPRRKKATNKQA